MLLVNLGKLLVGYRIIKKDRLKLCEGLIDRLGKCLVGRESHLTVS